MTVPQSTSPNLWGKTVGYDAPSASYVTNLFDQYVFSMILVWVTDVIVAAAAQVVQRSSSDWKVVSLITSLYVKVSLGT